MNKAIYFDMDGTIADLYNVDNWREKLDCSDPSPYLAARPLINLQVLARLLKALQREGYTIGIISWLSKDSSEEYAHKVAEAKRLWLHQHLASVQWNEIHLVGFGTSKSATAQIKEGILFDDNENVRKEWSKNNQKGFAYDEKNIIQTLKILKEKMS